MSGSPGNFRPSPLARILGRLYSWAYERDQRRIRRENPDWWARIQAQYRRSDRRAG